VTAPVVLGFISGALVASAIFIALGILTFYRLCRELVRLSKSRAPFAGLRLSTRGDKVAIEIPESDPRFPAYLCSVKAVQLGWAAHERHREAVAKEA
jgi:hypothetical protein